MKRISPIFLPPPRRLRFTPIMGFIMKKVSPLPFALAVAFFAASSVAHADNITDTGPGHFSNIDNSGTVDYITVTNSATIGNITNAHSGTLNGDNPPSVTTNCCGAWLPSLDVDNSTVTGSIINDGTIRQTTASDDIGGILVGGTSTIGGSIINNGQITLNASTSAGIWGILIDSTATVSGSVTNAGTLTLTNTNGNNVGGFYIGGAISGDVTNSGTMTVNAGNVGSAYGMDIVTGAVVSGNMTNNGIITAIAGNGGNAFGIHSDGTISGSTINNGTITATATGENGYAYGISSENTIAGQLTNNGKILVNGGAGANSSAVGIGNYGTLTGNMTNNGTIITWAGHTANTSSGALVNYGTLNGEIINTGTITATLGVDTPGWGIFSYGNNAVTINQNGGTITGDIGLSGLGDVFNINAGTVAGSIFGNVNDGNSATVDTVNLNGGTFALPATGYVVAIGNYTQGSKGTLSLGVTPTSSGWIQATNVTLGGTLQIAPSGRGWALNTPQTYIDFITANNPVSGAFATTTSLSPLFRVNVTSDGSDARSLSVTEVSAGYSPAINNVIAGLLSNVGIAPAEESLASGIEGLTAPQLRGAISQLTGTAIAQSIQAVRDVSSEFSGMVQQRLLSGSGDDTSGLSSLHVSGQYVQLASLDTDVPLFAQPTSPDGGAWVRGFGSFGSGNAQDNIAGFNQTRGGVIFGVDKKFSHDWTLGTAVQYAHTNLDVTDGSASSNADSYNGLIYGGWHQDRLYVNGTAGFGWNEYSSNRNLVLGSFASNPSGSFSGQAYTASAETGYAFEASNAWAGKWTLTPYAGLDYTHIHTGAFTESGDGVSNLSVESSNNDSLITTLGIRTGTKIETANYGTFRPEVHAAWQQQNLDEIASIHSAFVSSPGDVFSVSGATYGRDSAIVGGALTQDLSQRSHIFLSYDARLNGGYTEQVVSGGIRFEF